MIEDALGGYCQVEPAAGRVVLLAERGIAVSYETIRHWCRKFGSEYARRLKRREGRLGDTWHLDELFVTIRGRRQYLWRAVDQDGDVIDILLQPRRDRRAAERSFRRLPGLVQNLFRVGRHLLSSANHRLLRDRSFRVWRQATCAW